MADNVSKDKYARERAATKNFNQLVISTMSYFGDNRNLVSAIAGNAAVESAYTYDPKQKQIGGGKGYGVFQFDFHNKYYQDFLREEKLEDNIDSQVRYVYENIYGKKQKIIGSGNAKKLREIFASDDLEKITKGFQDIFLKPGKPHTDRRMKMAKNVYQAIQPLYENAKLEEIRNE